MSAGTVRVPRQRTPRRDPDERRPSAVYGIPCLAVDKTTGIPLDPPQVVVGYIGQSVQTVKEREEQHRDCQPFSDLIVGGSFTIKEGWWTQAELDREEQWYIERGVPLMAGKRPQRPVYNYDYNTGNPDRIEVWRAKKHRQAREPGWTPPAKGARVSHQRGILARVWGRLRRIRWTPRRIRFVVWSVLWLAVTLGSGVWLAVETDIPTRVCLMVGAAAASVLVGVAMPKARRRRKRRRR